MRSLLFPLCLAACGDAAPPAPEAPQAERAAPTADQPLDAQVDALVSRAKDGRLNAQDRRDQSLRPAFVHLVRTSEDPALIGAGLGALGDTWGDADPVSDAQAVLDRLVHPAAPVRGAAIEALGLGLKSDDRAELAVPVLIDMGNGGDAATRFAVAEALGRLGHGCDRSDVAQWFMDRVQDEAPYVVSQALVGAQRCRSVLPDGAQDTAAVLMAHPDPGVRGEALALYARLASPRKEESAQAILPMLEDPHAHVRARAATEIVKFKAEDAVEALCPQVDDMRSSDYELTGFQRLDGTPGRLVHQGSNWRTVSDSMVVALEASTPGADEGGFVRPKIEGDRAAALDKHREAAKEWCSAR